MYNVKKDFEGTVEIGRVFFMPGGDLMELSKENLLKIKQKTYGKVWVDDLVPARKRVSGSGLTFAGHYEKVKRK